MAAKLLSYTKAANVRVILIHTELHGQHFLHGAAVTETGLVNVNTVPASADEAHS